MRPGNGEHSADLGVLQKLKITHIVNATLKFKNSFEAFGEIKYLQLAIDDAEEESFDSHWDQIMEFMQCIDDEHTQNAVLVHCEMGISRSATITIAYLMHKLRLSLFDSYQYVLERRGIIRPNASFLDQLEKYEKKLFEGASTLNKVKREIREIYLQNVVTQQQQQ